MSHPACLTHYAMPLTKGSKDKKRAYCGATEGYVSGKFDLIDCPKCREVVERRKATVKRSKLDRRKANFHERRKFISTKS